MTVPEYLIYLTESDVRQALTMAEAVDLAEAGIKADAAGQVAGDKFYMPVSDQGFIKPFSGYMQGEELAFFKTFSFFPRNPTQIGYPTTSSVVLLFEAATGLPVCLMEANYVTALKTGASTAVTAFFLARGGASTVTIFGAGTQGRLHLRGLCNRLALDRAYVIDVLPQAAEQFAAELGPELELAVEPVALEDRERAVRQSDVIVTVTTGDQALVEYDWLRKGAFVAKLGSYQEVALDVITRADKVVVDNWRYVRPRIPELELLEKERQYGQEEIHGEWPDIVAGRTAGRESEEEIIVYIALGIWGEYAAILPEVYQRALAKGLGQRLLRTI